jgi:hypothetical protein
VERNDWARRIEQLSVEDDFHEIYRILVTHEFPWDMSQSLSFALFRTYAVPSIGGLLARTGEFTGRVQKRYDDTVLILDAILEHGLSSPEGLTALRRMNQMHGSYSISNEDFRYVLATFVMVPTRWLDDFGWRRLTPAERAATCNYYRQLGAHMGIKDMPDTYRAFESLMDDYERVNFARNPGSRAVADATLSLMTTFPPTHRLPKSLQIRFAKALMDDPLLDALGYSRPKSYERALARWGLRTRGRVVRRLPPREVPRHARELPNIRTYPDGYGLAELGTFPRERPVPPSTA